MKNTQSVFGILKGLVDKKVPELNKKLETAEIADKKIKRFQNAISDLERYIEINRYDREATKEAQEDIDEYERNIGVLESFRKGIDKVKEELLYADKFYKTYKKVTNDLKIQNLKQQYEDLDTKLSVLEDRMFACEINLDETERSAEVYTQSKQDFAKFKEEYDRLFKNAMDILKEIKALEK